MTREFATQRDILESIVDRLIYVIPEFTRTTCFFSDEPHPARYPTNQIWCTVATSEGVFGKGEFAGGGIEQCTEFTNVLVTVFSNVRGDSPNQAEERVLSANRGLVGYYKPAILRALLYDVETDSQWEPQLSGNPLLRNQIYPRSTAGPVEFSPEQNPKARFLRMQIAFGADFDWDLRT